MTAPVSLFVWMDRPVTAEESAQIDAHIATWRPRLSRGASGYALERAAEPEDAAFGTTHPEQAFAALMRQANQKTLMEQAQSLRPDAAPQSLRYLMRLQPGPNFAHDVMALIEAARELETLLPDAEVRLHDGQLLRNVRPCRVDREVLLRELGL